MSLLAHAWVVCVVCEPGAGDFVAIQVCYTRVGFSIRGVVESKIWRVTNQSLWIEFFTHSTRLFKKRWVAVEFTMEVSRSQMGVRVKLLKRGSAFLFLGLFCSVFVIHFWETLYTFPFTNSDRFLTLYLKLSFFKYYILRLIILNTSNKLSIFLIF